MAETIERLYRLTVDGTQAARSLSEIERATANLDKRLAASADSIKKFGAVLAGAVSVGAIVGGIKQVIDSFDQLSKDAQKIGIAAEDLQRLRYAADLSGVGAEQLGTAITKLAKTMGDLDNEGNKAAQVLKAIGVNGGDNAVEALKKIADQFAKMPDGMEKTALAAELFGKAIGPDMIPLLNAGGAALEELTKEADKFGGVVSGSVLKAAEEFNDNLSRLQRTASGIGAQLTAGMLPALRALSQSLTDSATSGDGFVSTGEAIGEMLLNLYGFALKAGATIQAFGMTIGAVMAVLSRPLESGTSTFAALKDDIDALETTTNTTLAKLRENFARFKTEAAAGPVGNTGTKATEDLINASKRAADAAEAHRKAEEARWKELIRVAGAEEQASKALDDRALQLTNQQQAILDVSKAHKVFLDNIEQEGARLQYLIDLTDETTEAYQTASDGLRAYAAAQLAAGEVSAATTKTIEKQRDEVDVLTDGFTSFFENLANGTADVEQLFKRMVQSIIAELLKLWAKKYIIDAIMGAFGGTTAAATGKAFDSGQVVPFARGGVISRPVMFPMALAGEAGPEAILPLQRAANGNLGVQAQTSPMNVTVNNYTDATVSTRQTGPNDLEVIIERTRAAIANDFRRGGNLVSNSLEQSYGVGRGAAAQF